MPTDNQTPAKPHPAAHRAFKFCLDPNQPQTQQMAQAAGAARAAHNMLVAHVRAALDAQRRHAEHLINTGTSPEAAAERIKHLRTTNPSMKILGYMAYATTHLTPEIQRHRSCATALANGADPATTWPDTERYTQPWLHTVPRRVLISGLQNASKAIDNWFSSLTGQRAGARMGAPQFKRKGSRDSFTLPTPEVIGAKGTPYKRGEPRHGTIQDYRHLRCGFLGTIRTHDSTKRLVRACRNGATIRSVTISRTADRWYASVLVRIPATPPPTPTRRQRTHGTVGVDLGVKHLAALSTGETIDNLRPGHTGARRLAGLQRKLARSQKGSRRRQRVLRQIARHHHLVSLRRETALHRVTKRLVTTWETVAIEDLNVAGMTRSARGTLENPGKNVAAKAGLNRSILDASLSRFRHQLEYKAGWYGARVRTIDRWAPSSKICSACGAVKTTLSLADRVFECEQCGMRMDRDVNAAINIRVLATTADGGPTTPHLAPGRGESLNGRGEHGRAEACGPRSITAGSSKRQDRGPGATVMQASNRLLIPPVQSDPETS